MNLEKDTEFCIIPSWRQHCSKLVSDRIHIWEKDSFGNIIQGVSGYVAKNLKDNKRTTCSILTFPISSGSSFQNYALLFSRWFGSLATLIPFNSIFCSLCSTAVSLKRSTPAWQTDLSHLKPKQLMNKRNNKHYWYYKLYSMLLLSQACNISPPEDKEIFHFSSKHETKASFLLGLLGHR